MKEIWRSFVVVLYFIISLKDLTVKIHIWKKPRRV